MFEHPLGLLKFLEASQSVEKREVEFGHFLVRLHPGISVQVLIIGLANLHFRTKGHVAINQELLNQYKSKLGLNQLEALLNEEILEQKGIGRPGEDELFIFDQDLIYDHKSHKNECALAEWLRSGFESDINFSEADKSKLEERFNQRVDNNQVQAVYNSFIKKLLLIIGGPGTGKTYTVKTIIEEHRAFFGEGYQIKIAAPTGKAAQRINDSFANSSEEFPQAGTIHQLLGAANSVSPFIYNRKNPIPVDLLIVDEASMMDLSMWVAMVDALPTHARLIIVGDPFQLVSVEYGSVLNNICALADEGNANKKIKDSIILLTQNYRFSEKTGIQEIATAINSMDSEKALSVLGDQKYGDVQWIEPAGSIIQEVLHKYAITPGVEKNFGEDLSEFRILCAVRNGPFGSGTLNQKVESQIKSQLRVPQSQEWFDGRLVMITKNDYQLGLQNGESGIYDKESDTIKFGDEKTIDKRFLKNYEPGYCITIHKSQGSEFKHVAIVLPNNEIPLLSKELLYTAVTRARQSVLVVGSEYIIAQTIAKRIVRITGLKNRINA